jgi:predicted nucleic acid-binding protein
MSNVVIADSSCLIALSKIGKLFILNKLFGDVIIPNAVYHEVVVEGLQQTGAKEVSESSWIKIRTVQNELAVRTLRSILGPGESEAIILAVETSADFIVLDDKKARNQATELSLPVIGTIAVLKKAVEKGIITDFSSILDELASVGFRYKFQNS